MPNNNSIGNKGIFSASGEIPLGFDCWYLPMIQGKRYILHVLNSDSLLEEKRAS